MHSKINLLLVELMVMVRGIVLSDPKLKTELVASGLDFPTTMAFLGPDDFLILEKAGSSKTSYEWCSTG